MKMDPSNAAKNLPSLLPKTKPNTKPNKTKAATIRKLALKF